MINVAVSNDLIIAKNQLSKDTTDLIREKFTYANPVFFKNARLGFKNWGVSPTITVLRDTGDCYHLPRGCLCELSALIPIAIEDLTVESPADFPTPFLKLREYQQIALQALLSSNQGLLVSPCGSGKTEIACAVIFERCQKTLVIVHTKDLLKQWADRIRTRLNIEPGIIGAGLRDDSKPVTVGTVQSLQKGLEPSFVNQFGMVILDEAHHCPARTFGEIINKFPARSRLGLSATPTRADGMEFLMHAAFGRILHTITDGDLSEAHTITPSVRVFETKTTLQPVNDYGEMLGELFVDEFRNSLITETVSKEARGGHSCLVLSQRINHITLLSNLLTASYPTVKSAIITGREPQAFRQQALEDMRSGELSVLFSCKLADEGLDIPRLDRLFLTAPIRSASRLIQQIGRIKRPFPGKLDAIVYDFLDGSITLSKSQFYSRVGVYKSQNIKVEKADHEIRNT
jgi:superfamily II DNA or RNA helicase